MARLECLRALVELKIKFIHIPGVLNREEGALLHPEKHPHGEKTLINFHWTDASHVVSMRPIFVFANAKKEATAMSTKGKVS
jgi:hypothetical protein